MCSPFWSRYACYLDKIYILNTNATSIFTSEALNEVAVFIMKSHKVTIVFVDNQPILTNRDV